eukprot:4911219-Amphidinium_carterae.1
MGDSMFSESRDSSKVNPPAFGVEGGTPDLLAGWQSRGTPVQKLQLYWQFDCSEACVMEPQGRSTSTCRMTLAKEVMNPTGARRPMVLRSRSVCSKAHSHVEMCGWRVEGDATLMAAFVL